MALVASWPSHVWLAEKSGGGPSEVLGIFSAPERARKPCQDDANSFFGERSTAPLKWTGDDGYSSAPHYDPRGNFLYQVTRFAVDAEVTP